MVTEQTDNERQVHFFFDDIAICKAGCPSCKHGPRITLSDLSSKHCVCPLQFIIIIWLSHHESPTWYVGLMMWASVVKRFNQIESIEFIGICFLAYGQNPLFFYG